VDLGAIVTLVLVGTQNAWLGAAVALAIIGLKVWSCIVMHRRPRPEESWTAPPA
jgi:hypothetical protein